MATSFREFMEDKSNGHLRSMKVSSYGAASVDSDQLIKSRKVNSNIRSLRGTTQSNKKTKM